MDAEDGGARYQLRRAISQNSKLEYLVFEG